jgi:hypothetical protein
LPVPLVNARQLVPYLGALGGIEVKIPVELPVRQLGGLAIGNFHGAAGLQDSGRKQHTDNQHNARLPRRGLGRP